jgi:hypothetical protein
MKKVQFIITATILSFGLIISAALISNAIYNSDRSQSRITVKGVAEKRVKADKAIINIIFSTSNTKLEDAQSNIAGKEKAVLDILKSLELKENEYQINNVKVQPKFSERQPERETKILSYDVMQSIAVIPKNIEKSDEIYQKLQELKITFNNIEIIKPEYYIISIEKYKKDLLISATENAEMRAIEMLKVNKNEIGRLENMTQGQFEVLPDKEDTKHVNDDELNQMYKKLRSVVTVTYLIKY